MDRPCDFLLNNYSTFEIGDCPNYGSSDCPITMELQIPCSIAVDKLVTLLRYKYSKGQDMSMSEQFVPKLIDNFEEVNQQNIETFKKHGTKKSDELRHKCTVCGRDVSIDNSFSCEGDRLVCGRCYYNEDKFPNIQDAFNWIWPVYNL